MTWGPSNPKLASEQHHSKKYLEEVRAFIEAVKQYTGAEKVDVIGHSMGVTLARKAIQGGDGFDPYERKGYNLGGALTNSVDTFVGIAGANHGVRLVPLRAHGPQGAHGGHATGDDPRPRGPLSPTGDSAPR